MLPHRPARIRVFADTGRDGAATRIRAVERRGAERGARLPLLHRQRVSRTLRSAEGTQVYDERLRAGERATPTSCSTRTGDTVIGLGAPLDPRTVGAAPARRRPARDHRSRRRPDGCTPDGLSAAAPERTARHGRSPLLARRGTRTSRSPSPSSSGRVRSPGWCVTRGARRQQARGRRARRRLPVRRRVPVRARPAAHAARRGARARALAAARDGDRARAALPACSAPIERDYVVCPSCTAMLRRRCDSCGGAERVRLDGLPVLRDDRGRAGVERQGARARRRRGDGAEAAAKRRRRALRDEASPHAGRSEHESAV